jgi:hypothetical protein
MARTMIDAYNLVKEALNPVPTENGVEFMAHWRFEPKTQAPCT